MTAGRELDARSLDHATLAALRRRAVMAVLAGRRVEDVAAALCLNRRTVFRWMSRYRQAGMAGLAARPIPGRPAGRARPPG